MELDLFDERTTAAMISNGFNHTTSTQSQSEVNKMPTDKETLSEYWQQKGYLKHVFRITFFNSAHFDSNPNFHQMY